MVLLFLLSDNRIEIFLKDLIVEKDMTFIYRKVKARDFEDANDLETRLNAHLVTDFALRMNEASRQIGNGNQAENPSSSYEFRVLYKNLHETEKVRDGSWVLALLKRSAREIPRLRLPTEVELVIECKPELVLPIDQFLIDEPYALFENREVDTAKYSFSTEWVYKREFEVTEMKGSKKDIHSLLQDRIRNICSEIKVLPDIHLGENYSASRDSFNLSGDITGNPASVFDAKKRVDYEILSRNLKIANCQIDFYKSSNGLYLPR